MAISFCCDDTFKNGSFVINRAPKIIELTIDFDENFIQMPFPKRIRIRSSLANFFRENRPKSIPPKPDGLMTNIDAALMQNIFDLTQTERKSDIIHDRHFDDFG